MRASPALEVPALAGRWEFDAMNSRVSLFTRDWPGAGLLQSTERLFHEMEERLSRFRPTSELSLLNAASGSTTSVSSELFSLLQVCRRFFASSRGLFDPSVLPDLERAGYDRSFELVPREASGAPAPTESDGGSFADVVLDSETRAVTLPRGMRLDLGGIGKGYIVDRAFEVLAPARDFLIDAGGDIRAAGAGNDGPGWLVGVADPFDLERNLDAVWLRDQALATSSIARRRWRRDGRWLHHLIDPRTHEPVATDIIAASVIAPTAIEADVFAKLALLLGRDDGAGFLEERGAHGLFVLADGMHYTTANWPGGLL